MENALIRNHGGYKRLISFQVAQLAYDITVWFCGLYIEKRDRTHDQMVQAARSGVQNIAEGSQGSVTSKKYELKLTGVARASLEELKLDYEDFLRQRGLHQWLRNDFRRVELVRRRPRDLQEFERWAIEMQGVDEAGRGGRKSGPESGQSGQTKASTLSTTSTSSTLPASFQEISANGALTLIVVASVLLDRQIVSLAHSFETEGGFSERLYLTRMKRREIESWK